MIIIVAVLFLFASCTYGLKMAEAAAAGTKAIKHLLVVYVPGEDDDYYIDNLEDIAAFAKELANKSGANDDVLVLYSPETNLEDVSGSGSASGASRSEGLDFGDALCYRSPRPLDLWTRDFGLVHPKEQVKFVYRPEYLKKADASYIEKSFMKLLSSLKDKVSLTKSDIILDGGNFVDNGIDKAIISDRVFEDNKRMNKDKVKQELERLLKMEVAFVPDPDDATGHSDGMVCFLEKDVVLIAHDGDQKFYDEIRNSVAAKFPDLKIFPLPCKQDKTKKFRGIESAMGCYVNILVTNNAVYVPVFSNAKNDTETIEIIKKHTTKKVVPINTSKLSHMGGSVRCMTWQVDSTHPIAKALYKVSKPCKGI